MADLPDVAEFDAREELLLDAAAEQADAIEALERDIQDRGYVVDGDGQSQRSRSVDST